MGGYVPIKRYCGAKCRTKGGAPCRMPAVRGGKRCRMHGGKSPGAPLGNQNALKHGLYTAEAKAELRTAELELEKITRDKELAVRRSWLMLENAITALEGRAETTMNSEP